MCVCVCVIGGNLCESLWNPCLHRGHLVRNCSLLQIVHFHFANATILICPHAFKFCSVPTFSAGLSAPGPRPRPACCSSLPETAQSDWWPKPSRPKSPVSRRVKMFRLARRGVRARHGIRIKFRKKQPKSDLFRRRPLVFVCGRTNSCWRWTEGGEWNPRGWQETWGNHSYSGNLFPFCLPGQFCLPPTVQFQSHDEIYLDF